MSYVAHYDASGGRRDAAALAIAHREGERAVLDLVRAWSAPHNPAGVIAEAAEELERFSVPEVQLDRFAGEFPAEQFRERGIEASVNPQSTSDTYLEFLPLVNSESVILLDHPDLLRELRGLERRSMRSGKDRVDHRRGGSDDIAAAAAGALVLAMSAQRELLFAPVLDRSHVRVEGIEPDWLADRHLEIRKRLWNPRKPDIKPDPWEMYASHERGGSGSLTYVVVHLRDRGLELPDGRSLPVGSFLLVAELSHSRGATVPDMAADLHELAETWGLTRPEGVVGEGADALRREFSAQDLRFRRGAKKGRLGAWERMRTLLQHAGTDEPGLYVADRCGEWWSTVPGLVRDLRYPDDVEDTDSTLAAKACRIALRGSQRVYSGAMYLR